MGGLREGSRIWFIQGAHGDSNGFTGGAGDDSGRKQEANGGPQGALSWMIRGAFHKFAIRARRFKRIEPGCQGQSSKDNLLRDPYV